MTRPTVRLLADDLTGALDTAAEFVPITGPLPVFLHGGVPDDLPGSAAIDSGTRERGAAEATTTVLDFAPRLASADIAYKKIDSLLRGPTIAEIAACMRSGLWDRAVLCPAFPFQGRAMRDGRQFVRGADGGWTAVTEDLVAALRGAGVAAYRARPGDSSRPGVAVFDAETDADMRDVVRAGVEAGRVLWVGAGGLAQAIASGWVTDAAGRPSPGVTAGPVLGLFGSDHAVTAGQLAACGPHWLRLLDTDPAPVIGGLRDHGVVLASFALPPGMGRDEAAERIGRGFAALLRDMAAPGTLVAAGGETLFAICRALGASHLEVQGRIVPGVPCSIMRGGRWDGVGVVSKSGAFGPPNLLRDLLIERTVS